MGSSEQQPDIRGFDSFEVRLGDELRGERATLGKSLLDVQRELRIKAAYIAAIENCDVDVFPNKGFVAGYVRSYARYMNLDPDEVFRRFCEEAKFGGVNAGLASPKKSSSGRIVSSGPVRVGKDDPLLKPLRPAADLSPTLSERISLSAVGSVVVLLALVVGLTYGGISVLHSIQRVTIAPIEQRPETMAELDGLSAPGVADVQIELNTPEPDRPSNQDIARLYEPRELELPVLLNRDGPIVDIDPEQAGLLARPKPPETAAEEPVEVAIVFGPQLPSGEPQVRETPRIPQVNVVAQRPAWIRVYQVDGTVIFEKILETGETYTIPEDLEAPLLRAGNAGSVFLAVDDTTFGPVGSGTGVAKNVSLTAGDITGTFEPLAEVPDVVQATLSALNVEPAE